MLGDRQLEYFQGLEGHELLYFWLNRQYNTCASEFLDSVLLAIGYEVKSTSLCTLTTSVIFHPHDALK